MALTQAITRQGLAEHALKVMGFLPSGGSLTGATDQLLEVGWVINMVLKSLDGAGWFRQRIEHDSKTLSQGLGTCTLATNVISLEAGFIVYAAPTAAQGAVGLPIICGSAEDAYAAGPVGGTGDPTHCWLRSHEASLALAEVAYFNKLAAVNFTFHYWYRAASYILAADNTTYLLTDDSLRLVTYLVALNFARMYGVPMELRGELHANQRIAMEMFISGQYALDPSVVADIMSLQGPQG